nr:uncharacterized protein LOC117273568 [Nicotiana tomentosiformis]
MTYCPLSSLVCWEIMELGQYLGLPGTSTGVGDNICHIAETYKPRITNVLVCWKMPLGDTWKINTDGSFVATSRQAGIRGIVKRGNGDLIMAFAKPVQFSTNILCELQASTNSR